MAASMSYGARTATDAAGQRQRKAYVLLAPGGELHAIMVAAATEWRDTWAAQGKADAPRFSLAKWIEREEYECSPPTAYQPKQIKTDKPVAGASRSGERYSRCCASSRWRRSAVRSPT